MIYMEGTREDPFTGRMSYLGTGIAHLGAAKRYLKNKFREQPLPAIVTRPGARFYVTARLRGRTAYLAGPYASHMTALQRVPQVRARLFQERHGMGPWVALGTASRTDTVPTRYGR